MLCLARKSAITMMQAALSRKGGIQLKKALIMKISILSASLVVVSGGAIAANIPAMARTFADVPLQTVEMLSTIPSLFIIISVLLSNLFARYLGYKRTILIGIAIVLVSGIIPALIGDFWIILVSRALFGFGVGMFNSLLIAIISHFYEGDERADDRDEERVRGSERDVHDFRHQTAAEGPLANLLFGLSDHIARLHPVPAVRPECRL